MSGICIDKLTHDCGTSDGLQVFADNETGTITGYCFSCGTYIPNPYGDPKYIKDVELPKQKSDEDVLKEIAEITNYPSVDLPSRKLRGKYLEHFGIKTSMSEQDGHTPTATFFPIHKQGKLSGYYIKTLSKPVKQWSIGDVRKGEPIGWEEAKKSGAYKLIIVEGREDAPALESIFDRFGEEKYKPAIIALPNGVKSVDSSLTPISNDIQRLFKEIIICFDMDHAGQEAVKNAMMLFPYALTAVLPEKDPNDCILKGASKAAYKALAFQAAKPKNSHILVSSAALAAEARVPTAYGEFSWPYPSLNKALRGMRTKETVYLGAGVKMGKALSLSTQLYTPEGIKTWGDIQVGDVLWGTNGKPTKVLRRDNQGIKSIYKVLLDDDTFVYCCKDHLWYVYDMKKKVHITVPTKHLVLGKRNRYSLPLIKPVEYPKSHLPIDPYVLGVWLGDGRNSTGFITNGDEHIWDRISITENWGIRPYHNGAWSGTILGLSKKLRRLSLLNNKHIPNVYLTGSVEQRFSLLNGIMDTDGWVEANGCVRFGSTDRILVTGVQNLVRSLGMKASVIHSKETGFKKFYQISIQHNGENIFSLPRKKLRCRESMPHGRLTRKIVDISYSHEESAMCVQVDSENSLFLANDYIPTHNSDIVDEVQAHLIKEHNVKVLSIKPEEPYIETFNGVAGKVIGADFKDPDVPFDYDKHDEATEIIGDKLHILDLYQHLDLSMLKQDIIYSANEGVRAVFLDPITNLTAGMSPTEANTLLTGLTRDLAAIAMDLDLVMFITAHLKSPEGQLSADARQKKYDSGKYYQLGNCPHERGGNVYSNQFTGSRAMMQACNLMLGLEGNKDPDLPEEILNTRWLTILESRKFSASGSYQLYRNPHTTIYKEI